MQLAEIENIDHLKQSRIKKKNNCSVSKIEIYIQKYRICRDFCPVDFLLIQRHLLLYSVRME